jgi:hypothetical protein
MRSAENSGRAFDQPAFAALALANRERRIEQLFDLRNGLLLDPAS